MCVIGLKQLTKFNQDKPLNLPSKNIFAYILVAAYHFHHLRILSAHFWVHNQVLQFDVIFQVCHDHHDHHQDCAQAGYLDLHWWCLAFPLCLLESSVVCLFVCFVAGNDLLDGLIFKEVYVSKSVMSLVFNSTPKPDSDTS